MSSARGSYKYSFHHLLLRSDIYVYKRNWKSWVGDTDVCCVAAHVHPVKKSAIGMQMASWNGFSRPWHLIRLIKLQPIWLKDSCCLKSGLSNVITKLLAGGCGSNVTHVQTLGINGICAMQCDILQRSSCIVHLKKLSPP